MGILQPRPWVSEAGISAAPVGFGLYSALCGYVLSVLSAPIGFGLFSAFCGYVLSDQVGFGLYRSDLVADPVG